MKDREEWHVCAAHGVLRRRTEVTHERVGPFFGVEWLSISLRFQNINKKMRPPETSERDSTVKINEIMA